MTRPKTPPPPLDWVLLANAGRARLFERDPANGAMRERAAFLHPGSRVRPSVNGHDRPGHVAKGQASTQMDPHTTPREREMQQFALQLAQHLDAEARAGHCTRWMLVASSPFLGRLRAALPAAAASRLASYADRDLSAYQGSELEQRVTELLPLASEASA